VWQLPFCGLVAVPSCQVLISLNCLQLTQLASWRHTGYHDCQRHVVLVWDCFRSQANSLSLAKVPIVPWSPGPNHNLTLLLTIAKSRSAFCKLHRDTTVRNKTFVRGSDYWSASEKPVCICLLLRSRTINGRWRWCRSIFTQKLY